MAWLNPPAFSNAPNHEQLNSALPNNDEYLFTTLPVHENYNAAYDTSATSLSTETIHYLFAHHENISMALIFGFLMDHTTRWMTDRGLPCAERPTYADQLTRSPALVNLLHVSARLRNFRSVKTKVCSFVLVPLYILKRTGSAKEITAGWNQVS